MRIGRNHRYGYRILFSALLYVSAVQDTYAEGGGAVQSGTGFFVSNTGHIITNEHVVRGCETVVIRGTVKPSYARLLATDAEHDLALLKSVTAKPARVAPLRNTEKNIFVNDPLMVIGYPLDRGVSGVYKVALSRVMGLEGPQDEPHWIQFADAALQGNSGGPLLDASGNVVGVVVGKTKLKRRNKKTGKEEILQESDVAVSLPVLKQFLHDNQVYFRTNMSKAYYSIDRVENQARQYVLNIHCKPSI